MFMTSTRVAGQAGSDNVSTLTFSLVVSFLPSSTGSRLLSHFKQVVLEFSHLREMSPILF